MADVKPSEKARDLAYDELLELFEDAASESQIANCIDSALTVAYAADAVVPRAMLEEALDHSKRLSALLSGGEHDLLESERGWKRRAETAERSLSEARAEIAGQREALDHPYGFTMPEIIEIGKAVLPHLSSETTSQIGSIAHDVAAAVTRVMRDRAALAASNGATDAQS